MDPNLPDTRPGQASGYTNGEVPPMGNTGYTNQTFSIDEKSKAEELGAPPAFSPPMYYPSEQYPQGDPVNQAGQPQMMGPGVVTNQPMVSSFTEIGQPQQIVVVQEIPLRPSSYCCLSCCIIWFCNLLFGLIAFGFSMMSMRAYVAGHVEQARKYGRISLRLNVTGIIVTSIIVVIIILSVL